MMNLKSGSCCVCYLSGDGVESLPLVGWVGRTTAMRSIVRKWRPGWGLPQAQLPLWLTPTRLAQMNLGQPPMRERSSSQTPQGGGKNPRQPLVFLSDRATQRAFDPHTHHEIKP